MTELGLILGISVLGLAFLLNYCGATGTMGLALAAWVIALLAIVSIGLAAPHPAATA